MNNTVNYYKNEKQLCTIKFKKNKIKKCGK